MRPCAYVVAWIVVAASLIVSLSESAAQTRRDAPQSSETERIVREWALRGVIISDTGRSAVLEHLPSGREQRLELGHAVTAGVAVVAIDRDRVVLNAEGGTPVTLRLGHGGQPRIVRPPVRPARGVPPPTMGRHRSR